MLFVVWALNILSVFSIGVGTGCHFALRWKNLDELEGNRNFFWGVGGGLLAIRLIIPLVVWLSH